MPSATAETPQTNAYPSGSGKADELMPDAEPNSNLLSRPIQPPHGGRQAFVFDGSDWHSVRDAGIRPRFVSDLAESSEGRSEFVSGARILGLVGGRKKLAPQQLVLSDVLDAGHKFNGVLLPRRSAKSTSLIAKSLGRAEVREDYRVGILTMTTGKAGRSRFMKDVVPLFERAWPDKKSSPWKVGKSAGQERVVCLASGGFVAWLSSIEDLRGEAFDLVILDEAGEAEPDKVEDALGAALPTLDTRPGGQIIAAGTAGKYRTGNLLWDLLEMGREGKGGILEYSAPESTSVEDLERWETAAPVVLGAHPGVDTLTTLESVEGNWRALKPDAFMREYLGIFGIDGASKGLIKPDVWAKLADPLALPEPPERFTLALAVHRDQLAAALTAAWRDEKGRAHLLVLAHDRGVTWVHDRARKLAEQYGVTVVHDSTGPVLAETEQLARDRVKLLPQTTRNITTAAALLMKQVEDGRLVHHDQPGLNEAVRVAVKRRILSAWGFGTSEFSEDITPLEAGAMALRVFDDDRPPVRLVANF